MDPERDLSHERPRGMVGRAERSKVGAELSLAQTAPKEYIESLFDGYAKNFENSLVRDLEYETPRLLSNLLSGNKRTMKLGSVLDLGCGTGLLGLEIHKNSSYLEGIVYWATALSSSSVIR